MNTPPINPVHWRLDTLLACGPETIDSLARAASGTLTSYRVILGRCLLAMDESRCHKELGCSSSVHYAIRLLGLSRRVALGCRRVARRLLKLPQLTIAAETGTIPWSKLREIVRKASIETEPYWLELARRSTYKEIQYLVSQTPEGSVPGEAQPEDESTPSELRCALPAEVFHLLEQARRALSKEKGEAVTTAEVLEWSLSGTLAGKPASQETLEKTRCETDKDMAAERARRNPVVWEARELALEMGLLGPLEPEPVEEDLLSRALGLPVSDGVALRSPEQGVSVRANSDDETPKTSLDPTGLPAQFVNSYQAQEPGRVGSGDEALPTWANTTGVPARVHPPALDSKLTGPARVEVLGWQGLRREVWENELLCFNGNSRNTTVGQKKELHRRDGYCCATPGCPNHIWLQVHHIQPYSEGGLTERRNLICLCYGCHRNVHEGRLRITCSEDGRLLFTDGEGRRLDRRYDLEVAGWIDYWLGWSKGDSYSSRVHNEKWSALPPNPVRAAAT